MHLCGNDKVPHTGYCYIPINAPRELDGKKVGEAEGENREVCKMPYDTDCILLGRWGSMLHMGIEGKQMAVR